MSCELKTGKMKYVKESDNLSVIFTIFEIITMCGYKKFDELIFLESSGATEFHHRALRELDVTVSRHPAPIVQP